MLADAVDSDARSGSGPENESDPGGAGGGAGGGWLQAHGAEHPQARTRPPAPFTALPPSGSSPQSPPGPKDAAGGRTRCNCRCLCGKADGGPKASKR